ncbi:MAG TPA: Ig-like domain-containing protein [Vicinamibacterales bacterium]|nr:Ig-like domain-containing protein [Vicinamibacterales bacterium]
MQRVLWNVALGSAGLFGCLAAPLVAQPASRLAATPEALIAAPVFYHGKQIAVRRDVEPAGPLMRLAGTAKPIFVFWRDSPSAPRDSEVRGEFWDVGRLERTDSRFSNVNFQPILDAAANGQWPARDQVFIILNATTVESPLPVEPTVRALALAPDRYVGKGVTVTGRFRGANLFADLPQGAGTRGRWDFVLQSADSSVWVSGVRPRGRNFDLDVNARADTGRWVQVAGTVRRTGPLAWIEATSITEATPPSDTAIEVSLPPPPPAPAPEIIFSVPQQGDVDVERGAAIRIQFSRDMDGRTFRDRVRLSYVGPTPAGGSDAPPAVTVRYNEGNRALEIKPSAPLDRYRTVKLELLEGILSNVDNQPLAPASLTFTTGGG